jgi:hypothetical protein
MYLLRANMVLECPNKIAISGLETEYHRRRI